VTRSSSTAPLVLGLNVSHNGSACLVRGDRVLVAIQEERLSRRKYDRIAASRPSLCVQYCLHAAGVQPNQIDLVVVATQGSNDDPVADVHLNPQLRVDFNGIETVAIGHHLAHAWSAYASSAHEDAMVLVVDGVGSPAASLSAEERRLERPGLPDPWETASLYHASPHGVVAVWKDWAPHGRWMVVAPPSMPYFGSLGGMYEAAAEFIFKGARDAGKVMGLAPYGTPVFARSDFFEPSEDGFVFFPTVPRRVDHRSTWDGGKEGAADLAASVQNALEEGVLWLAELARLRGSSRALCYAGGVALNSVANQKIVARGLFDDVFVVPSAEDAGVALGAAHYGVSLLAPPARRERVTVDAPGAHYDRGAVERAARIAPGLVLARESADATAQRLTSGQIVGLFTGGSEFGPRSLGQRSILCDPRPASAKERMNERVKHREAFRPFAPAVIDTFAAEWFDFEGTDPCSPFMLRVVRVRPEKAALVPAIVHVDGTARVQTVSPRQARLYELLQAFFARTGVPLLLNTSFNVMHEPIVETPLDAVCTFVENDIDALAFEDAVVHKDPSFSFESLVPERCFHSVVRETAREERIAARRETAWGRHGVPVSHAELELLDLCAGRTIAELRACAPPAEPPSHDIVSRVAALRRRGLLTYAASAVERKNTSEYFVPDSTRSA
jgi:carbamoyltransferase